MRLAPAALIVLALAAVPSAASRPAVPLANLLDHATHYVGEFVAGFASVVAEERYVQDSHPAPDVGGAVLRGFVANTARHRELRSDFLFVRTDQQSDWLTFRDVYTVDGREVRGRDARLAALFEQGPRDMFEQARRIAVESYRYTLGPSQRTLANPLLALTFLEVAFRTRFAYRLDRIETSPHGDIWVVEYEERARPTIVRDLDNRNVPASGRLWIDATTGAVLQTELKTHGADRVMTRFVRNEVLQLYVPVEMRDVAWVGDTAVTGVATYSNFRRFDVLTDEHAQ